MCMTTTDRQVGDPTTECPKCAGPRVWKRNKGAGTWFRYCSPCSVAVAARARDRRREREGWTCKAQPPVPATRQDGDPAPTCKKCAGPRIWKKYPSGWIATCRPCDRQKNKKYRDQDPQANAARCRRYHNENKEAMNERTRTYKQENKEVVRRNSRVAQSRRRARMAEAPDDGWSFETITKMVQTGEHKCFMCESAPATDVEHLLPISMGGGNTWDNLAMACKSCNSAKGGDNRHDKLYPGSPGWDEFLQKRRGG